MLENGNRGHGVDQLPLLPGPLSTLGETLRGRNGREPLVNQPNGHPDRTSEHAGSAPSLRRSRPLAATQTPWKPHEHLDRPVLIDQCNKVGDSSAPACTVLTGYASTPSRSHAATPIRASPQSSAIRTPRRICLGPLLHTWGSAAVNGAGCRENVVVKPGGTEGSCRLGFQAS
jgi:hypothetical protein